MCNVFGTKAYNDNLQRLASFPHTESFNMLSEHMYDLSYKALFNLYASDTIDKALRKVRFTEKEKSDEYKSFNYISIALHDSYILSVCRLVSAKVYNTDNFAIDKLFSELEDDFNRNYFLNLKNVYTDLISSLRTYSSILVVSNLVSTRKYISDFADKISDFGLLESFLRLVFDITRHTSVENKGNVPLQEGKGNYSKIEEFYKNNAEFTDSLITCIEDDTDDEEPITANTISEWLRATDVPVDFNREDMLSVIMKIIEARGSI